jgi:hypothetical protein
MLSVIMLSVVMLSVIILSVVMPMVTAPTFSEQLESDKCDKYSRLICPSINHSFTLQQAGLLNFFLRHSLCNCIHQRDSS